MSKADEMRGLLDEHGIGHFDFDKGGRTQTQWEAPDGDRHFTYETYDNPAKTAKLVIAWFPTPEQAIAATLGGGYADVDDALALLDEIRGANRITHDDYSRLHDAISVLGSETCEPDGWYRCDCGCVVGYSLLVDGSWTIYMDDYQIPFSHCPNCGAKVVGA